MRTGVIGPMGPDLFAENVVVSLRHMGHLCEPLGTVWPAVKSKHAQVLRDIAARSVSLDRRVQRRLVDQVRDHALELVITVDSTLLPETVAAMKRAGAAVVLWFPDHLANLNRQLMFLAPYDGLFFKDPLLVERLSNLLDLPVHYLPEACNPMWHRPIKRTDVKPYLVLAGNMYPSRIILLDRLVAAGIPIQLYGPGFDRWIDSRPLFASHTGRYLSREKKAETYRLAAGVLNNLHPSELTGVNCRLFEAAGSGGAVLCEDRPALKDLFEPHAEVLPFATFDELVDQAQLLLKDAEYGTRVGDAAALRSHGDHTYERRLSTMLKALDFDNGSPPSSLQGKPS